MKNRLLIIGNQEAVHIGAHFFNAAKNIGLEVAFCDVRDAYKGPFWLSKVNWHLRGKRPNHLDKFSETVIKTCRIFKPNKAIFVGIAPVEKKALKTIGEMGIETINYLTDDPWNPAHKVRWFMEALLFYDRVFSTRQANIDDLRSLGCKEVSYLPFAYAPEIHFPEIPATDEERLRFGCDVVFVGGADCDRVKFIRPLIKAGFKITLYGGYWSRFAETRVCARDHIGPEEMRKAVSAAKVNLCLVRRANRDGNSMRTFEIPAIGGCILAENTVEHRQILGEDGQNALYFNNIDEMIQKTKILISNEKERIKLAEASHRLITNGKHTYKDRLIAMLEA